MIFLKWLDVHYEINPMLKMFKVNKSLLFCITTLIFLNHFLSLIYVAIQVNIQVLQILSWYLIQIREYEKLQFQEDRLKMAREIFDKYIMIELLACSHVSNSATANIVE